MLIIFESKTLNAGMKPCKPIPATLAIGQKTFVFRVSTIGFFATAKRGLMPCKSYVNYFRCKTF